MASFADDNELWPQIRPLSSTGREQGSSGALLTLNHNEGIALGSPEDLATEDLPTATDEISASRDSGPFLMSGPGRVRHQGCRESTTLLATFDRAAPVSSVPSELDGLA